MKGCLHIAANCSDSNACTNDACTPQGCVFTTVNCDDGDACSNDFCDAIKGCGHSAIACNDNNPCTNDVCDKVSPPSYPASSLLPLRRFYYTSFITFKYVLQVKGCIFTAIPACNQTGPHTTQSCNDNDFCTNDVLTSTGCTYTPISCDDLNACTSDRCSPTFGMASSVLSFHFLERAARRGYERREERQGEGSMSFDLTLLNRVSQYRIKLQ